MSDKELSDIEKKFINLLNERKKLSKDKELSEEEKESFKKLICGDINSSSKQDMHCTYMVHPSSHREENFEKRRQDTQHTRMIHPSSHHEENFEKRRQDTQHTRMIHPSSHREENIERRKQDMHRTFIVQQKGNETEILFSAMLENGYERSTEQWYKDITYFIDNMINNSETKSELL